MTDTLRQIETPTETKAGAMNDAPAPASAAGRIEEPPAESPGRHGEKPPRLRSRHLTAIVGASLVALAVVCVLAFGLIVSWLHDASQDAADWAAAETHLDEVHELATQQFLQATQAMRSSQGLSFVIETQGNEIASRVDELVAAAIQISGDTTFGDHGAALQEANTALTAAGIKGIEDITAGKRGADTLGVFEIELAFAGWRRWHSEFSEAMRTAQSSAVSEQSSRADMAALALGAVGVLAAIVLGGAWRLRARASRREAKLQDKVQKEKELLNTIINQLPESIVWKDNDILVRGYNAAMAERYAANDIAPVLGKRISDCARSNEIAEHTRPIEELERQVIRSGKPIPSHQITYAGVDGSSLTLIYALAPILHQGKPIGVVTATRDITEIVELERSLASAGRLESIGQLAAGVAHEINTPVQFVSDNTMFLDDSFADLIGALRSISEMACDCNADGVAAVQKEADLDFLVEEIPDAITQSKEGLQQIAQIVRAMKDFAHPGGDAGPADINRLIKSTVDVSRNEWKYEADVELELGDNLPHPHGDEGQLKQVLLNMIVNAAHAIADSERDRGTITVTTGTDGESVSIRIADDGAGMTDEVKERIFERFFTTKEIGRGSGQGLAIAHDAIKAHGGTISVDSKLGVGTTFTIELPIEAKKDE